MTFSVILCNFNDAEYLSAALASILGNSTRPDQLILVDDGSSDGSVEIMSDWAAQYPEIEIIRNERNIGPIRSANAVLSRVSGDYVAWWSADDVVRPALIAEVGKAARTYPDAPVIATRTLVVSETGETLDCPSFETGAPVVYLTAAEFRKRCATEYLWLGSSGLFLKTAAVRSAGGWRLDFDWFADWAMTYDLALSRGVVLLEIVGSEVRQRGDSFGSIARSDRNRRRAALVWFFDFLAHPDHGDERDAFTAAALVLRYAMGNDAFREMAKRPRLARMLTLTGLAWIRHRARRSRYARLFRIRQP